MNRYEKRFLRIDREKARKNKMVKPKPVINTERVKAISLAIAEYFKNSEKYKQEPKPRPKQYYTVPRILKRFQKEVSITLINEIKNLPRDRININYLSKKFNVSIKTIYSWKKFGFDIINSEVDKIQFIEAVQNSPKKFIIRWGE
jgi:hydroxymethylpyrimidine pyrophosphatase-like HAD family hydrolase